MARLRIYLDTSVFGALLDADQPHRVAVTEAFLRRLAEFEAHLSPTVIGEVSAHGDAAKRQRLMAAAHGLPSVVSAGPEIDSLVAEYLRWGALPASASTDAVHVAAATAARLDALVSWNFKHLVRLRTRRLVQAVNAALGYGAVDIVSPEEL